MRALVLCTFIALATPALAVGTQSIETTPRLSPAAKNAAVRPFVIAATRCMVKAVMSDPTFGTAEVNDLIVKKIHDCVLPMRAMIDAYDRYFGAGSGEAFFMGPYLDVLPAAIGSDQRPSTPEEGF